MFSVLLDTTQDISIQDQCSVILIYVNFNGIHQKLLAVVTMQESTSKGLVICWKKFYIPMVLISKNVWVMQRMVLRIYRGSLIDFLLGLISCHQTKSIYGVMFIF